MDTYNDFVAIDFETSYGHIPCSLGIVEFSNGEPINEYYTLIKPIDLKFNPINSRINGIFLEDVFNKKEFDEIWNEIEHFFIDKNIVAHNASTDITILNKTLDYYKIHKPDFKSFCTLEISKSLLELENYKLSTLASYFQFNQNNYHNALEDAYICGQIFNEFRDNAFEYIKNDNKKRIRKPKSNASSINTIKTDILLGKTFMFTGTLTKFNRTDAQKMVEDHGGKNISAVSKNLNFLVVGDKAGSKLKKAEEIGTVVVLTEDEFLNMIND